VKNAGNVILSAYIAVLMAALILGPLVILKGYRAWWLVVFYAVLFVATIGGTIGHFSHPQRNEHA
jgi:cytochrome c biogenesis protein ResB